MSKLYLAYGSNMNLRQMAHRCPTAKMVAVSELKDYRLMFRGGHGSAVATIEPEKGCSVPVMLWEIGKQDEVNLDIYEGYPRLYRKETVKVKLDGRNRNAMVYIMNSGRPVDLPSIFYLDTIQRGYEAGCIDFKELNEALRYSKAHRGEV